LNASGRRGRKTGTPSEALPSRQWRARPQAGPTYAGRKAVASRHGHDEAPHDEAASKHEDPEGSARDQEDDSEYADNEVSAADGDEDTKESEDYDEQEDEPEGSAEEDDEGYDDDDPQEPKGNGSDRPRAGRSLRTLVNPSRLASASQLLLPLAEETAASAGRYVGEHAPGTLREQSLPRFIEAFEEAAQAGQNQHVPEQRRAGGHLAWASVPDRRVYSLVWAELVAEEVEAAAARAEGGGNHLPLAWAGDAPHQFLPAPVRLERPASAGSERPGLGEYRLGKRHG
jgi:hypothetical protein